MLGESIEDLIENGGGTFEGLGLLPVVAVFGPEKVLARPQGTLADGTVVAGYEIHHGRVTVEGGTSFFADQGCRQGSVAGTTWHGLFENDLFRRSYLSEVADLSGRDYVPSSNLVFDAWRDTRINTLADLMESHLDMAALLDVLAGRAPTPPRVSLSLASS